jgi:acetyl esterase
MPALPPAVEALAVRSLLALPPQLQRLLVRRPVVLDDQQLSTETQLVLALRELAREPSVEDLPVAEGRDRLTHQSGLVGGRQPIGAIRDLLVEGAVGSLAARLYVPSSRVGAEPVPTMLFLHGGGWVYGDLASHDAACRHLAEQSGVQVLAVDYRCAPENPFPAAVDDAVAAYRWLVEHLDDVNADPARLAVGGDSAGGNLSAVVAVVAAREGLPLAFQLLVYPATDFTEKARSRHLFGEGFYLTETFIDQCTDWYLPAGTDRSDPRASPLLETDLPAGLAPAHIVTAGFDPLRDEGEAYADLLAAHGVAVTRVRYPSMIHGFFNIVGVGREARSYNREIADVLGTVLAAYGVAGHNRT